MTTATKPPKASKTSKTSKTKPVAAPKTAGPPLAAAPTPTVGGVVIGILTGFAEDGQDPTALVDFDGNPSPGAVAARALTALGPGDIGKSVALQFERGDIALPVVIGLLYGSANPSHPPNQHDSRLTGVAAALSRLARTPLQISLGDDEVVLTAERKLTLRCGGASITLDADGDIEMRGQNLLSRAAGQNRIKGSSVSLN